MVKLSFLFPGQGVQFIGMSKAIYEEFAIARHTFEEAEEILHKNIDRICFEGSLSEICDMENLFPIIITCSIATYNVYMSRIGILPQFVAGHSLGEYSALVASGAMEFKDALNIVSLRGKLAKRMANNKNGMSVVSGIDSKLILKQCDEIRKENLYVDISCYNSPDQVTVSGDNIALKKIEDYAVSLNANISPLLNSAPLHSMLMSPIIEEYKQALKECKFHEFNFPVISNVTAKPYSYEVKDTLAKQIVSPVLWENSIMEMKRYGTQIILEMGPKPVFSNSIESNFGDMKIFCYGNKKGREEFESSIVSINKYNFIDKCLKAAVSTPNKNFNSDEYLNGVIIPYQNIERINQEAQDKSGNVSVIQMKYAIQNLKIILDTKKLKDEEKNNIISSIYNQTGTKYLLQKRL